MVSPARGEFINDPYDQELIVGFPFNWFPLREGSMNAVFANCTNFNKPRFHSIGFPCERGVAAVVHPALSLGLFPFNWFPLREGSSRSAVSLCSMQFPFNWFPLREGRLQSVPPASVPITPSPVSIQLVSPARGEQTLLVVEGVRTFPFNWFPLREGSAEANAIAQAAKHGSSIQLVSPARGE